MQPYLASAYSNQTVLVTGHTGFKGAWLVQWLDMLGARVVGYALEPPTVPSAFEVANVASRLVEHHLADIRDRATLTDVLARTRPALILHLAAQTVVRESYRDPVETFSVNVVGTAVLLDAVRQTGLRCAVVVVTSDKCYENDESGRPLRESDRMGGADPYSASKGAAEIATAAFRRSYFPPDLLDRHGVALATARAGNVIGGGDWTADGLVADIARALLAGRPIGIRNPDAIRPWQHVLEPLSGYLLLGSRLMGPDAARFVGGWNFGPTLADCVPVRAVADRFLREWGTGAWIDESEPDAPPEAGILRLSTARARHRLGWRPRWRLAEAVRRAARWFRRYASDPADAASACEDDIRAFMAGAARGG